MRMIDVGAKAITARVAIATARIRMLPATLELIRRGQVKKGDVLAAARLAAVMAAKKTPDLIPLCHPISLASVEVMVEPAVVGVEIRVEVKTSDRTGVEMEALTAASAAALTLYDMLKSEDRGMVIENIQLVHKSGGRSGSWTREEQAAHNQRRRSGLKKKKRAGRGR